MPKSMTLGTGSAFPNGSKSMLEDDAAHPLRRDGEKWVLFCHCTFRWSTGRRYPSWINTVGLKRVIMALTSHVAGCQPVKLVIHERDQFVDRLRIAVSPIRKQSPHASCRGRRHVVAR